MSYIRLLTMGQSFIGMKRQNSRYKVTELNLVPKFSPSRPPGPNGTQRLPFIPVEQAVSSGAGDTAVAAEPGSALTTSKNAGWREKVAVIAVKLVRSNPFSSERAANNSRRMVQSELLLQNIKVVRNDLHDADLEIRPLPTLRSKADGAPTAASWQKVFRRAGEFARSVVFLH